MVQIDVGVVKVAVAERLRVAASDQLLAEVFAGLKNHQFVSFCNTFVILQLYF